MGSIKRNITAKARILLQQFPVLAILGARQTGKTTLAKQLGADWRYFDLEKTQDRILIENDPLFFLQQYPEQIIVDEAQLCPELFTTLRGVIDANRAQKGRFIITGSSSPELLKNISESLAGRIALIELGTLKANEIYEKPLSNFFNIFANKLSRESLNIIHASKPLSQQQLQHAWVFGGYPEPLLANVEFFWQNWMQNYQDTYINRDLAVLFPRLNKIAYRTFLTMLGKLSGTILNKRDLARAVAISEPTIREYLSIAEGTYLWRNLPSFQHNIIKSIIKMPKGHIRDLGLLHHSLRIDNIDDLLLDPIVGHSFEIFVTEEIIKGLQATNSTNWETFYFRTKSGAEIDLIIEGPFGLLPIEIKHTTHTKIRDLANLSKFIEHYALPFGMLVNQAEEIVWLTPKIIQIPARFL
ncbi:MAG: ATPase [Legionellales bacterium]|nr:MAG: ATPase [Legionellales bacterium]